MSGARRPLTEAERELEKHKRDAEKLKRRCSQQRNRLMTIKRRCTQQKNKLMTMTRQLGETREENTKLRCALSQAIAKFDEFKESDEEFQKFVDGVNCYALALQTVL